MREGRLGTLKRITRRPEMNTLFFLIVLCTVVGVSSDVFFSSRNIINILRQISTTAICAVGMSFIIISGGIDLSVGTMIGLTAVVGAYVGAEAKMNMGPTAALIAMVGVGALCGLFNGLMVTRVGLPPFIATLGTQSIANGVALMIAKATPIKYEKTWITFFGSGTIGNIPFSIFVMFVMVLLGFLVSRYTVYGRNIYFIGNSEKAAQLSGINVKNTRVIPYMFSSLMAALAGLILLGQMMAADASYGNGNELDAIAASVIGGVSMTGGEGNVIGVVLGAAVMGVIRNAFVLLRVSSYWQTVSIGLVIIASVSLDCIRKKVKAD